MYIKCYKHIINICKHIYIYIHTQVYVYMWVSVGIYTYRYIYIYMSTYKCTTTKQYVVI